MKDILTIEIIDGRLKNVRRMGYISAVLVFLVGLGIGFYVMSGAKDLLNEGKTVSATIIDMKVEDREHKGRARDARLLFYSYSDESGKSYDGELEVAPEDYETFRIGSLMEIVYFPTEPSNHQRLDFAKRQASLSELLTRNIIMLLIVVLMTEALRFFSKKGLYKKLKKQEQGS